MKPSEIGARAERKVAQFLKAQGAIILEKNYRTRQGEIDLIIQEGSVLAFVEVRYRCDLTKAAESVDIFKQRKIEKAAQDYLSKHEGELVCRFDVVLADATGKLKWLKDAFNASD